MKVGDKVMLVSDSYGDSKVNPVWGGANGKVLGTVSSVGDVSTLTTRVSWDILNTSNNYKHSNLQLLSEHTNLNIITAPGDF